MDLKGFERIAVAPLKLSPSLLLFPRSGAHRRGSMLREWIERAARVDSFREGEATETRESGERGKCILALPGAGVPVGDARVNRRGTVSCEIKLKRKSGENKGEKREDAFRPL